MSSVTTRSMLAPVVFAVALAACRPLGTSPAISAEPVASGPCIPTLAHARPPDVVVDFMRGGSSPQPSYNDYVAALGRENWAGNDVSG